MGPYETLKQARQFIIEQGGKISPLSISEEEINPESQDDLSLQAYALESTETTYQVPYNYPGDASSSEFAFFEDGRQRTVLIGHIRAVFGKQEVLIPVHYFVVGAVILQRKGRSLEVWDRPLVRQGILVQKSLVPDQQRLANFERIGLTVEDVDAEGGDYYVLRSRAYQTAKRLRLQVEDELIRRWKVSPAAEGQFLVVDGTLMNFRDEQNIRQCIGVSKSFGARYFSTTENHRILQMGEFERSWTFKFHHPGDDLRMGPRERVSWYLRIRSRVRADPEFGLIRVEISKDYASEASKYAERFSRSLISERLPASYPCPRWDKLLYPIKACEDYLSSIIPSIGTIVESMKGVV